MNTKKRWNLASKTGDQGIAPPKIFLFFNLTDFTTSEIPQTLSSKEALTQYWQSEDKNFLHFQRKNKARFDTIRQRGEDWDNCGSKKTNIVSLCTAKEILDDLLSVVVNSGYLWLMPFISSDEDGNISIEWHKGQHELHVDVSDTQAEYVKVWGTNIENEMYLDFLDRNSYLILWEWLLSG